MFNKMLFIFYFYFLFILFALDKCCKMVAYGYTHSCRLFVIVFGNIFI